MTTATDTNEQKPKAGRTIYRSTASDAVYGFGLIGAWIYYLSHAATFWMGLLGILKGIVWPAMLVYGLMKYLGM